VTTRVYVNEQAVDVPPGESAAAAVRAADSALGEALVAGRAYLTDGRGVRVSPDAILEAGAILRVVRSTKAGDDAHA
jgi:hypothetical protein